MFGVSIRFDSTDLFIILCYSAFITLCGMSPNDLQVTPVTDLWEQNPGLWSRWYCAVLLEMRPTDGSCKVLKWTHGHRGGCQSSLRIIEERSRQKEREWDEGREKSRKEGRRFARCLRGRDPVIILSLIFFLHAHSSLLSFPLSSLSHILSCNVLSCLFLSSFFTFFSSFVCLSQPLFLCAGHMSRHMSETT